MTKGPSEGSCAGDLIRAARHEDGLSLDALSERLGVSLSFLSDVERDMRTLTFQRWGDLFRALPSLDPPMFVNASLRQGPVHIDLREIKDSDREAVARILTRAAKAQATKAAA